MKLTEPEIDKLLELAIDAAKRAGAHIQSETGKPRDIVNKEGHTLASQVVTEVDFESQRLILDSLEESMQRFGIGMLTEESEDDNSRQTSDYFWCIDPIDGTLPFIEDVAGYSVSIGLVSQSGEPTIGVILDPRTGTIYSARLGAGTKRNGESIELSTAGALTVVMDRTQAALPNYEQLLAQFDGIATERGLGGIEIIDQGGAAMSACWVIDHAPALYFKFPKLQRGGGALWDFAASACLFSELGEAVVCDFKGAPLKLNREGCPYMNKEGVVFASEHALAEAVRRLEP